MPSIRLQLLLNPLARNERTKKDVRAAADQLGLTVTGEGAATLSARCDRDRFVDIFGAEPLQGPAGTAPDELPVPAALSDYVSSVSIAPAHLYMDD